MKNERGCRSWQPLFFMSIWGGRMRYAPTDFVNIMLNVIPIIILCWVSTDIERSRDAAPSEL